MPSLADTLDTLSSRSSELAYLSTLNSRPDGPFVQAYLGSSSSSSGYASGKEGGRGNVLRLIRDSSDGETRLFKFIGEASTQSGGGVAGGGGGGNKKVEKRENVLVTPLKDLKKARSGEGGRDEVEVVLRTAMKLVDDYRPMPRARAHIANLLDSHHASQERLVELERLIEEASNSRSTARATSSTAKSPTPTAAESGLTDASASAPGSTSTDQPKLTTDEAIKAEEAALRALEASLIPLRRANQSTEPTGYSPPPPSTKTLPSSPPIKSNSANTIQTPAKTPTRAFPPTASTQMQTLAPEMPHVTNSLVVNGMTPRRVDRFSPLKLLTPRAPIGSSGLRNNNANANDETGAGAPRRSIFGRPSNARQSVSVATPGSSNTAYKPPAGPFSTPYKNLLAGESGRTPGAPKTATSEQEEAEAEADQTIVVARPSSPPVLAPVVDPLPTPVKTAEDEGDAGAHTPKAHIASEDRDDKLEGIDINAAGVQAGVAKIWSTLGEMMRQGTKDGQEPGQDVDSSVKHLIHLSNSDVPRPPSPSSSSTSSMITTPTNKPITSETILFAHLLLSILRSIDPSSAQALASSTSGQEGGVDMTDLKEQLTSIAKARQFDGANTVGTKMIYAAVGKRAIRIDRKGGSGKIRFAV
ncbi:uncharacterized protein I303_106026 [Kwoniella dejecticola CBS 10117]|uniref:Uncharacterized protein n=1 Tax=Kwoniella dejecticola CBS 10117 TaxID=1296121 RepID=A0A1A6A123_9TREE|nr:uncharacterized protein I303_06046 [Kwoniella dejecticola CBS 10117]OBR83764.1 hypothetical protein I303_06046 [Kwoniella dejecticola CBS 10117]